MLDTVHILPLAWNKDENSACVTGWLMAPFGYILENEDEEGSGIVHYPPLHLLHTVHGTDKSWNMICLNPGLHRLWSKCFWGFKWLGKLEAGAGQSTAVLQFRWLPQFRRDLALPVS